MKNPYDPQKLGTELWMESKRWNALQQRRKANIRARRLFPFLLAVLALVLLAAWKFREVWLPL